MTAITGLDADVLVSSTPSISTSNEACDNTDSGVWKVFEAHTHKYWDDAHSVTVQDSSDGSTGWATVDASTYTFTYAGGIVTFATAHAKHFIRVTGYYSNVAQVADCSEWSLDLSADTEDSTVFQATWAQSTTTVKKASAKISSFIVDDTLSDMLGSRMVLILYADKSAGSRWQGYASLTGVSPKVSATKLMTQEASFVYESVTFYAN